MPKCGKHGAIRDTLCTVFRPCEGPDLVRQGSGCDKIMLTELVSLVNIPTDGRLCLSASRDESLRGMRHRESHELVP